MNQNLIVGCIYEIQEKLENRLFECKTIALYVQELKYHLQVGQPCFWTFKAVGQSKFKVLLHENDSNRSSFPFCPNHICSFQCISIGRASKREVQLILFTKQ